MHRHPPAMFMWFLHNTFRPQDHGVLSRILSRTSIFSKHVTFWRHPRRWSPVAALWPMSTVSPQPSKFVQKTPSDAYCSYLLPQQTTRIQNKSGIHRIVKSYSGDAPCRLPAALPRTSLLLLVSWKTSGVLIPDSRQGVAQRSLMIWNPSCIVRQISGIHFRDLGGDSKLLFNLGQSVYEKMGSTKPGNPVPRGLSCTD